MDHIILAMKKRIQLIYFLQSGGSFAFHVRIHTHASENSLATVFSFKDGTGAQGGFYTTSSASRAALEQYFAEQHAMGFPKVNQLFNNELDEVWNAQGWNTWAPNGMNATFIYDPNLSELKTSGIGTCGCSEDSWTGTESGVVALMVSGLLTLLMLVVVL